MPRFRVWYLNGVGRLEVTEVTERDGFEAAFLVRKTLGRIYKVELIREQPCTVQENPNLEDLHVPITVRWNDRVRLSVGGDLAAQDGVSQPAASGLRKRSCPSQEATQD